LWIGLIEW